MTELIITNGDAAAAVLAAAGVGARIIPWRDVLHEGPLVPAPDLESLSDVRASFLSERFDLPYAEARADFLARDAVVKAHGLFSQVSIWLEHDLYDQLQLLQILHFFEGQGRTMGLRLVQADDFLATQKPETILRFAEHAIELTPPMLASAGAVWRALIQPAPEALVRELRAPSGAFRFLRPALARFIEELPSTQGGLTRTERAIATTIAAAEGITPREVFRRLLAAEDAPFMGDWSAFRVLDDLAGAGEPLVHGPATKFPCQGSSGETDAYLGTPLSLTGFGRSVLAGETDMIAVNGIDRWWAGTHLQGRDCWRWDAAARRIVPPGSRSNPRKEPT